MIGYIWQSTIIYCYSSAVVVNGGGLVGDSDVGGESGSTALNCYWDTEASGQVMSELGTGYSTEIMKIQAAYSGWDFESTWTMDNTYNDGYPYLQSLVPTETALPITLTDFNAEFINGSVELTWTTESETNNAAFILYRNGEVLTTIPAAGTSSEPHVYTFIDRQVVPGCIYDYVLADVDYANTIIKHSDLVQRIQIEETSIPVEFKMDANFPNPFNPVTIIPFAVPSALHVTMKVYDLNGSVVRTLIDGVQTAGSHQVVWDGRHDNGKMMTSGMYIVKMTSGNFSESQKLMLMK